jgi:hypothetical protein
MIPRSVFPQRGFCLEFTWLIVRALTPTFALKKDDQTQTHETKRKRNKNSKERKNIKERKGKGNKRKCR